MVSVVGLVEIAVAPPHFEAPSIRVVMALGPHPWWDVGSPPDDAGLPIVTTRNTDCVGEPGGAGHKPRTGPGQPARRIDIVATIGRATDRKTLFLRERAGFMPATYAT